MSVPPDLLSAVRLWVRHAEADLRNAEHTLKLCDEECPFETVGFHAQQCAEKYLKALLIAAGREPPRIHNLVALRDMIAPETAQTFSVDDLADLTPHAAELRYPGDFEPIGRAEAAVALAIAKRVRIAARAALPSAAFDTGS